MSLEYPHDIIFGWSNHEKTLESSLNRHSADVDDIGGMVLEGPPLNFDHGPEQSGLLCGVSPGPVGFGLCAVECLPFWPGLLEQRHWGKVFLGDTLCGICQNWGLNLIE